MNKTRLGITGNAYATLVFASGLMGNIPVLLLAGVALIMEENEWLKRMCVKAVSFMVVMKVFSVALLLLPDLFSIISSILVVADVDIDIIEVFTSIISIFQNVLHSSLTIFTNVMLVVYALLAYKGKYAKVLFVERFVNRNM